MEERMKKTLLLIVLLFCTLSLSAKELKAKTGDVFGFSTTEYFYPLGISSRGSRCTVTGVCKAEDGLWCLRLAVWIKGSEQSYPVQFEYYVKPGDELSFFRFPDFSKEVKMKVKAVNWNEVVLDVE
jgi:hypothetical protein